MGLYSEALRLLWVKRELSLVIHHVHDVVCRLPAQVGLHSEGLRLPVGETRAARNGQAPPRPLHQGRITRPAVLPPRHPRFLPLLVRKASSAVLPGYRWHGESL